MTEIHSKPETGPGTRCPRCDGSGDHPGGPPSNQQCPECDGTGWLTPKTEQPYGMVLDDMDHQAKYQSATIKPRREQAVTIGYMDAFDIAQKGFDAWKAKEHNAKWFRRIDGTPIPNDLLSNIAEAFAHNVTAQTELSADHIGGVNDMILGRPWMATGPCVCSTENGKLDRILFVVRAPMGTRDVPTDYELSDYAHQIVKAVNGAFPPHDSRLGTWDIQEIIEAECYVSNDGVCGAEIAAEAIIKALRQSQEENAPAALHELSQFLEEDCSILDDGEEIARQILTAFDVRAKR